MHSVRAWAGRYRYAVAVAGAAVVSVLLIIFMNLFAGLPQPKAPAESLFRSPEFATPAEPARSSGVARDFADRPLFSATRRIKVAPVNEVRSEASKAAKPVQTLDGWALLGIFDSGEVKGALVRHSSGRGHRVSLGEQVDGWRLVQVAPRSVRFESVGGNAEAELSMTLATVEILPVTPDGASDQSAEIPGAEAVPEQREQPELMTFKGYYGGPPAKDE